MKPEVKIIQISWKASVAVLCSVKEEKKVKKRTQRVTKIEMWIEKLEDWYGATNPV